MADEKDSLSAGITLKRNVTIKAIVTENFKKFLTFELNQAVTSIKLQIDQISEVIRQGKGTSEYLKQLSNEIRSQQVLVEDLMGKIEKAKTLEVGKLFVQGTIEGFTSIKKGDNLYHKLGAVEVILQDGVVQEIKSAPKYTI